MSITVLEPTQSTAAPSTTATNTLILAQIPVDAEDSLKRHFQAFGKLRLWLLLSGLRRIVVVYDQDEAAEQAKLAMDFTLIESTGNDGSIATSQTIRVYRGHPTSRHLLDGRSNHHLPVPETDKNFLISPPGSPPVGWEQIREDPPNADTLAEDLMRALEQIKIDDAAEELHEEEQPIPSPSPRPIAQVIRFDVEDSSLDLPTVLISDDSPSQPTTDALAKAFDIQRRSTPRPDFGSITDVKATVDSMLGSSGPRIDRTARPPIHS